MGGGGYRVGGGGLLDQHRPLVDHQLASVNRHPQSLMIDRGCWAQEGQNPPPPKYDVLFSVSDTVCIFRFNQVWHRE